MPDNSPGSYNVRGVPTSGLKKPKKFKIPKLKRKKKVGKAATTKELEKRLAERRGTAK